MIVAHQGEYAAMPGGTGHVGVAKDVARAIDTRAFAVPHTEDAIEFALATQLGLLRAPNGGGGQFLVEAGLEFYIGGGEEALRPHHLLVEAPERRAAIAGDESAGVEAGAAVALPLHQESADQRMIARDQHSGLAEIVFVVEAGGSKCHELPKGAAPPVPRTTAACFLSYRLARPVAKANKGWQFKCI